MKNTTTYSEAEVLLILEKTLVEHSDKVLADIPDWFNQFRKPTNQVIEVDTDTSLLIEKDKALFVAFYYFEVGHNTATLWQTFDDVYAMACEFVKTYNPNDGWEERSFEDYMVEFIKARVDY
jgi:hypothetical protein